MAIDMFLKVEGASGESKDSNHKGWTDITSFSGALLNRAIWALAAAVAPAKCASTICTSTR